MAHDLNYMELLSFDRTSSVYLTNGEAGRKLVAWSNRVTIYDHPPILEVDDGTGYVFIIRSAFNSSSVTWAAPSWEPPTRDFEVTAEFTDFINITSFSIVYTVDGVAYSYTGDGSKVEGFFALESAGDEDDIYINLCDSDTRDGADEARIEYEGISRSAMDSEMDEYIRTRLLTITDEDIKGHKLNGTWRLTEIRKNDTDSPDKVKLVLIYKKGYAQELNFDEAILFNKEDYRTDSTNLVILFPNIDPRYVETAKAPKLALASLSNPVFGGVVYAGAWNNIKMVTTEVSSGRSLDDACNVIWMLSQHNNQDLYFKYQATPHMISGHFFKWEATTATIDTLVEDVEFEPNGEIADPPTGTSKGLDEIVYGRTIIYRRTSRDDEDRLFDLEIQINWTSEASLSTEATPSGMYNETEWIEKVKNSTSLPSAEDLAPELDDESIYTDTPNHSEDTIAGQLWHQLGDDEYYQCTSGGLGVLPFTNTGAFTEVFPAFGLWRIDKELTGPTGTGLPLINDDGTYTYAVVYTKTTAVDADWHIFSSPRFKTSRGTLRAFSGIQPVRQRLGGELAYEADERGNPTGVDWNTEWDDGSNANGGAPYPRDTEPDNWESHGYRARYGEWKPHWTRGFLIGEGSLYAPIMEGSTCRGVFTDEAVYQLGDVVYFADGGDTPNGVGGTSYGWYALDSATDWDPLVRYFIGDVIQYGNAIYTAKERPVLPYYENSPGHPLGVYKWDKGGIDNTNFSWTVVDESFIASKIAIDGVGTAPFDKPDYHIPLKQELQRKIEWDSDWEWNGIDTYPNGHIIVYLVTGLRYEAKGTPASGTLPTVTANWDVVTDNPTDWDASRVASHGEWRSGWTKGYAIGSGSLKTNPDGSEVCRGVYDAANIYAFGDVTSHNADRSNPQFKVANSATAWDRTTSYAIGDVVLYGHALFTAREASSDFDQSPGHSEGASRWDAGALGSLITWTLLDDSVVISRISTIGAGVEPFEAEAFVSVLNEDGTNAYSQSARYSFYSNYAINPRVGEEHRCTMQRSQTLEEITYFAMNPHRLSGAHMRMPQTWADTDAMQADAESSTAGILTIPYNSAGSNFELDYTVQRVDPSKDLWAIHKTVTIYSEEEDDEDAALAIINRLPSTSSGSRLRGVAMVRHDRTGMAGVAWDGPFLDVS